MKSNPVRMCVSCRIRFVQNSLYRLSTHHNELTFYDGIGRSIYLCSSCLLDTKKEKKINNILQNKFKVKHYSKILILLKEKAVNG